MLTLLIMFFTLLSAIPAWSETRQALMRQDVNYIHALGNSAECGTLRTDVTLQCIIDELAGAEATILLTPETWTISNSLTIPRVHAIFIPMGGLLTVTSGDTLTIAGPIECASTQQCFAGLGSVHITGEPVVYPEWFGAIPNDDIDDEEAINKASASLTTGGTIMFQLGQYDISDSLLIGTGSHATFVGQGEGSRIVAMADFGNKDIIRNANLDPADEASRDTNLRVSDLYIDANSDENEPLVVSEHSHCVNLEAVYKAWVERVTCKDPKGDGVYIGGGLDASEIYSQEIFVSRNVIINPTRNGISKTLGAYSIIENNIIYSAALHCIDFEPDVALLEGSVRDSIISGNLCQGGGSNPFHAGINVGNNGVNASLPRISVKHNKMFSRTGACILFRNTGHLTLEGNECYLSGGIGSNEGGDIVDNGVMTKNNLIVLPAGRCFSLANITNLHMVGDTCHSPTGASGYGLQMDLVDAPTIIGMRIYNAAVDSMLLQGVTDGSFTGIHSEGPTGRGIFVTSSGGTHSTGNSFTGGRIQGSGTTGLTFSASNNNNMARGVYFASNNTNVSNSGTGNVLRENFGYVTEANVTGTIGAGATSQAVNHGLSATPTLKDIVCTPHGDWGSALKWWLSTPTSTQFTLNVDQVPGGAGIVFGCSAAIR